MLNLKFAGISDPTANTKQTAVGGTPAFSANMEIMSKCIYFREMFIVVDILVGCTEKLCLTLSANGKPMNELQQSKPHWQVSG